MTEEKDPNHHYKVDIGGTDYYWVRGSDIIRDGMYLELSRPYGNVVMEIFYSDITNDMTLMTCREGVPLTVVEKLIADAKRLLPPKSQ